MSHALSRAAAVAAALLATTTTQAADYWVYFGTYTGGKDGSKGIYRARMDTATGKLSAPELAAAMSSPSFVTIHPNGKFLYAVGEGSAKDGGPVVAFEIDPKTGALKKLNEGKSGGAGPCHIAIDPRGMYAGVANYGGGSSAFFELENGRLGKRVTFTQHKGSSVNKSRQEAPHAHSVQFVPGTREAVALVADLGLDKVKVFTLVPASGGFAPGAALDITLPPGCGPRHTAIAPDAKFAYVCGEIDSTVHVIKLNLAGKSEVIQSLSTLPAPVKGNSTAECVLHPSGKFVYVSNRGHNSVAVFKVGEDRKLTAAGYIKGDIKTPRNFNIDPSGRWMLIASQDGGKVGVYEIDPATGLAKETGDAVKVSNPVCVKFVAVGK